VKLKLSQVIKDGDMKINERSLLKVVAVNIVGKPYQKSSGGESTNRFGQCASSSGKILFTQQITTMIIIIITIAK